SSNPRLFEFPAAWALHLLTLWGIFKLARPAFGTAAAYTATALFGLSEIGLFYATSLWPRGHPCFYVWMAYWLQRWAREREPWALPLATTIWAAGMYVSPEIAPAAILVPVVWYVYRPPIQSTLSIAAIAVCLFMWWPYLGFESSRNFIDLRALI